MSRSPPMFSLLADLFERVMPSSGIDFGVEDWQENLIAANDGNNPSDALRTVAAILPQLKPVELAVATKVLADGTRYEPWRLPLGEDGILDFYLDYLAADQTESAWTSDVLRLIGNTCADLDTNRERVIAKLDLSALIDKLKTDDYVDIAIVVLNNLCSEYEPGEEAARRRQLFPAIIRMLERKAFNPILLDQICDLLGFSGEDFDPTLCPDNSISILCDAIVTQTVEVDNQVSLGIAIVNLLKHEHFKRRSIVQDDFMSILALIVFSYTQDSTDVAGAQGLHKQYSDISSSRDLKAITITSKEQSIEDEQKLSSMRQSLSGSLWDLSSGPDFAMKYLGRSNLDNTDCVKVLVSWLQASESQMQLCACYVLRNLASSDKASSRLVQGWKAHIPLIHILSSSPDHPVLEEALRLLKNLALPAENKSLIGLGTTHETIATCWSRFSSPTLQLPAVGLTRVLLKGCASNVYHFLGLFPVTINYANISKIISEGELFRLFSLYRKSTDIAIKVEVARTVVEIWRTAHNEERQSASIISRGTIERARQIHANIAEPIVTMIMESNNPSLVTEGWFGLTLIASSREGSGSVAEALSTKKLWNSLVATAASQDAGPQDRANTRILLDKLRKYDVSVEAHKG